MSQKIAQASGLASAGSTWTGGVAPVDGDCIKIPSGFVVTQDVNRIYGSKTDSSFHAVEILGTNAGSFGQLVVNDGVTMTLRSTGNDNGGPSWSMHIGQWGKFSPAPGATILLDVPADDAGAIGNEGIIDAIGTSAKPVTFDIPAANKNWNTPHSYSFSVGYVPYDRERSIAAAPFNAPCISNAAGTDIGAFGDSSAAFSAVTPAGILTTPVASIAAVNSVGKYFVDHQGGYVFFYTTQADSSTCAFTVTAKKLGIISARIRSRANWDGNQAVFRYCHLTAIGTHSSGAIEAQYKTNVTGTRRFEVTHCLFKYGYGVAMLNGVAGASGDPVLIEDNEYLGIMENDYTAANFLSIGSYPYLSIQRNTQHLSKYDFLNDNFSDGAPHAVIDDNVSWSNRFIQKADRSKHWDGASLAGNAMLGRGGMDDTRLITSLHGTLADPVVHSENLIWRAQRGINYGEYNDLVDNVWGHTFHHLIMAQDNVGQGVSPRVRIKRNVIISAEQSGAIETGYNYDSLQDGPEVEHNTLYKCPISLSVGDLTDSTGMQMQLGMTQRSNIVVQASVAVHRPPDVALQGSRVHFAGADYNNIYGSTSADFDGTRLQRFCTPSGLVNVAGVSLFNPSFSAPVSGKTLALVVGSSTSRTLSWDGGTPVQLFRDSGTVTSAEANLAWPDIGYLNDSSKAWPVLQYNNASSVVGAWVLMTSGANAGQVRRILNNNTGSRLILAYGWTSPLAVGDTYQIWWSEVTLANAGATQTISAGIDLRVLPSTSQTDTGVAIAFNGKSVDPLFVDPTRDVATWDASLGGAGTEEGAYARLFADPTLTRSSLLPYIKAGFVPTATALATAAHDGTTIGAMQMGGGTTHLAFSRQPGGAALGALLSPQPIVQRQLDTDNSLSTDTRTITLGLVTVSGGPGVLNGTKSGAGPQFAPTDLYITGSPGVYELSASDPANSAPNTPTISHSALTSTGATLTGSAFSDPDVGDTHAASQWQVTAAADTGFASPVISTADDAVNKTSYAATGLTASTPYIARVRYKDSAGNYSGWSASDAFTTSAAGFTASDTGFNFRLNNTDVGYTNIEGSGEAVCIGEAYPHTFTMTGTGETANAGFTVSQVGGGRNRSTTVDRRLAGIIFEGGSTLVFKRDVVAGASYDVRLALGDPVNAVSPSATVKDGSTVLFSVPATSIAAGHALDAMGTDLTDAAWPGSNVAHSVTMVGTVLSIEVPVGLPIQHIRITRTA